MALNRDLLTFLTKTCNHSYNFAYHLSMDKKQAVKAPQQYVLLAPLLCAVQEMIARFPGFLQKRGKNKGTPFDGSEISFKGSAGTKQAFFYTCWEREGNWTFKIWILQQFDSSNLTTGNFISTKNWNLMSFTSGLEIGPTKRPNQAKYVWQKKGEIKDKWKNMTYFWTQISVQCWTMSAVG